MTFCGHREVYQQEIVAKQLDRIMERLIREGAKQFLFGGYGQFDLLAAKAAAKAKREHGGIESVLVIPYLLRTYCMEYYDRTWYPPLEQVPPRYAIIKRNEYMVDAADLVVAYVIRSWGGAAKTLAYAKRKKKPILSLEIE